MQLRFDTIIDELNISNATLQNWIKTEQLTSKKNGYIDSDSYDYFKKNILGKSKLNKRANKQHLKNISTQYIESFDANIDSTEYENSLSIADKNKRGIYYTPNNVIDQMLNCIPVPSETDTFLDPCCGTGNFLIKALEKGFKPENIYGFDVDKEALKIANKRFYQTTRINSNNIKKLNVLEEPCDIKYTHIFTNPPWGYKFNSKQKEQYAKKFSNGVKLDSSALFVLIGLKLLQKDGYFGVLLPDAFFNISAFKFARTKLLKKSLIHLINHDKPFKGLQTKAYSFILQNKSNTNNFVKCSVGGASHNRKQIDFINNPNQIINFEATKSDASVIHHLYSLSHTTLIGKAEWGLGIVTGNNNRHLSLTKKTGFKKIYKGKNIDKNTIESSNLYIKDDFSQLQQTAKKELYMADKKIVYRFINSNLIFAVDDKQRYFLNSANFLILNKDTLFVEDRLQITEEQLVFLMNSEIMNWLFKKLFNTHKVLRSDLEKLPIWVDFFQQHSELCEEKLNKYLNIEKYNGAFRIKK
jgi:site-specific DNA-methyltransferase (adenine-specific)